MSNEIITVRVGPSQFGEYYELCWNWEMCRWDRTYLPLPKNWKDAFK